MVLDEDRERIEVVVPDQQLSLAIGRRGQNVRLASQLTGWDIDILTEQEESERRQAEFEKRTKVFMEALNVDEVVGQLLASEGFTSVEELAYVEVKELAGIEGFDEDTAGELPVWLAPVQAIVLPIADRHVDTAKTVERTLREHGVRAEVDERTESVGRKIREAELRKIPFMLVVGDREAEEGTVAVREHRRGDTGAEPVEAFARRIAEEGSA